MIFILVLDRLDCQQTDGALKRVNWLPEVTLKVWSESLQKTIAGRTNWCLAHGDSKEEVDISLIVLYVYFPIIRVPTYADPVCNRVKRNSKRRLNIVGASSADDIISPPYRTLEREKASRTNLCLELRQTLQISSSFI